MIAELVSLQPIRESQDWDTMWHSHSALQLGFLLEGPISLHFRQFSEDLTPGDFYAIAPGHLHRIQSKAGTREYHGFCRMTRRPRYFSSAVISSIDLSWVNDHSIIVKSSPAIGRLVAEMQSFWSDPDPSGKPLAQCILLQLFHAAEKSSPEMISRTTFSHHFRGSQRWKHEVFLKAVHVMEQRYADKHLDVEELAARCSISRSLLDRAFHHMVGHGPKRFLQHYRVDRAKELIRDEQHKLAYVADITGFPDIYTFSRVFKRLTGYGPSRHRKEKAL